MSNYERIQGLAAESFERVLSSMYPAPHPDARAVAKGGLHVVELDVESAGTRRRVDPRTFRERRHDADRRSAERWQFDDELDDRRRKGRRQQDENHSDDE